MVKETRGTLRSFALAAFKPLPSLKTVPAPQRCALLLSFAQLEKQQKERKRLVH